MPDEKVTDRNYNIRPLIMHKGLKLSSIDKETPQELLVIHIDHFLSEFALQACDPDFHAYYKGELSHFAPQPDIFLHGFDENFLEHIDQPIFHISYRKYKEDKRLDELLPLKGCVITREIENHLLTRGPLGHLLDTAIRCLRQKGWEKMAGYREITVSLNVSMK